MIPDQFHAQFIRFAQNEGFTLTAPMVEMADALYANLSDKAKSLPEITQLIFQEMQKQKDYDLTFLPNIVSTIEAKVDEIHRTALKALKGGVVLPPIERAKSPALFDVFPATLDTVKMCEYLGGGTAAAQRIESEGRSFVLKNPSQTGGVPHLLSEHRANIAYALLGVPAATTKIYHIARMRKDRKLHGSPSETKMLSVFIKGRVLGDYLEDESIPFEKRKEIVNQARKYFAIDAFFSNWDVLGPKYDNMLVGEDGVVYRIDNGSAFSYTGYGKPMGDYWSKKVGEYYGYLSTNPKLQRKTITQFYEGLGPFQPFGRITDQEILRQTEDLLAFFDNSDNAHKFFSIFADAPEDAHILQDRLKWIRDNVLIELKNKIQQ